MGEMQSMKDILNQIPQQYRVADYDEKRFIQMRCDSYNKTKGDLTGYDCPECLNKGMRMEVRERTNGRGKTEFYDVMVPCKCSEIRDSIRRLKRSGLENVIEEKTFDRFETDEPWRSVIKQKAIDFINDPNTTWFFIGGNPGSGKSHLCTAIAAHYLKVEKKAVRYMVWNEEIKRLKAAQMDEYTYSNLIEPLKKAEVLYIDDFFKPRGENDVPTESDIGIAFEIINYRYNNPNLITIISSERWLDEIIEIDEATGSRIMEHTRGKYLSIQRDPKRNYRRQPKNII